MNEYLAHSLEHIIPIPVIHIHGERRRREFPHTMSIDQHRPREKQRERERDNCLHIPQGEAPGLISVATAKALKSLWPPTYIAVSFRFHIDIGRGFRVEWLGNLQ